MEERRAVTVASMDDAFEPTHVLTVDTTFYRKGPQQARPPDGTLASGTRVRVVAGQGSYTQVETEEHQLVYVESGALGRSDRPRRRLFSSHSGGDV
jgi:hypothetical protein